MTTKTKEKSVSPSGSFSKVENTLVQQKAECEADEPFLGEPTEAEIIDFRVDNVSDEDTVIEFDLVLPNEKIGTIGLSESDFEQGRADEFLENIHCTRNDIADAMYNSVPVTFTEWDGWVVLYGESKHLDTTYTGDSKLYRISKHTAFPRPNKLCKTLLGIPFYIGGIISILSGDEIPIFIGILISVFLWYLNISVVSMSSPYRKSIKVTSGMFENDESDESSD